MRSRRKAALLVLLARSTRARIVTANFRACANTLFHWGMMMLMAVIMIVVAIRAMHVRRIVIIVVIMIAIGTVNMGFGCRGGLDGIGHREALLSRVWRLRLRVMAAYLAGWPRPA